MKTSVNKSIFLLFLFQTVLCSHEGSFESRKNDGRTSDAGKHGESDRSYFFVSDFHRSRLATLRKNEYNLMDADSILNSIRKSADNYCSCKMNSSEKCSVEDTLLIRTEYREEFRKSYRGSFQDLISGCWNFFRLNDFRPDLDFHLIKSLYPSMEYDCYSVGLLQPFIMQNILRCSHLTMIDADWRILDVQMQFFREFRKFRASQKIFEGISFSWTALEPGVVHSFGTLANLCREIQIPDCKKYLDSFDESLHFPDDTKWELSLAEDMKYNVTDRNSLKVIFLSNVIDDYYTNDLQFKKILNQLKNSLKPDQKSLIIHHVGGWKLFGLYEAVRKGDELELLTVCKDRYLQFHEERDPQISEYKTHFERNFNNGEKIPSCQTLLAERHLN